VTLQWGAEEHSRRKKKKRGKRIRQGRCITCGNEESGKNVKEQKIIFTYVWHWGRGKDKDKQEEKKRAKELKNGETRGSGNAQRKIVGGRT